MCSRKTLPAIKDTLQIHFPAIKLPSLRWPIRIKCHALFLIGQPENKWAGWRSLTAGSRLPRVANLSNSNIHSRQSRRASCITKCEHGLPYTCKSFLYLTNSLFCITYCIAYRVLYVVVQWRANLKLAPLRGGSVSNMCRVTPQISVILFSMFHA